MIYDTLEHVSEVGFGVEAVEACSGNCPAERGQGLAVGCLHMPCTGGELLASVAAAKAVLRRRPLPRRLPSRLHLYNGR